MGSEITSTTYPAAASSPAVAAAAPEKKKEQKALITWTPTISQEMNGDDRNWTRRTGWNGQEYASSFRPENITFRDGLMRLDLNSANCPAACGGQPYASAEYRSAQTFQYGYFEARLKPAKVEGVMGGSFFLYGGGEVDWEFVSDNATSAATNFFLPGSKQGHEKMIELGYDFSADFHNFGIKWAPEELVFYIDGEVVRRVKEDPATKEDEIPHLPMQIMTNLWAGTQKVAAWLGRYSGQPAAAEYDWIRYSTLEAAPKPAAPSKLEPAAPVPIVIPETAPEPVTAQTKAESDQLLAAVSALSSEPSRAAIYAFNGATVTENGGIYTFSAAGGIDPGFSILLAAPEIGREKLKFNLKGEIKSGSLDIQLYGHDQLLPSVIFHNIKPGQEISRDFGQDASTVKKVQFIIRSVSGQANLEIGNLRFE